MNHPTLHHVGAKNMVQTSSGITSEIVLEGRRKRRERREV
jgi:hypothetical protein